MMLVSKLTREEVVVALLGDGGDELFCGYKMYDWIELARRFDDLRAMCYNLSEYANEEILVKQGIFRAEKIQEFIRKMMHSDLSVYSSVLWEHLCFRCGIRSMQEIQK